MVEPMRPDPAEAVQCSRFRQLSRSTQVHHAQPTRHAQPTHRWLAMKSQSDSTWYARLGARLTGAPAVAATPQLSTFAGGYSEHRDELQAEAILGCNRDRIALLAWYCTHMPPAAAFQAQSSSCRLRACIPCVDHTENEACGLSSPHRSAGRGRSALESRVSVWTRVYRPTAQGLIDILATRQAHTSTRPVPA